MVVVTWCKDTTQCISHGTCKEDQTPRKNFSSLAPQYNNESPPVVAAMVGVVVVGWGGGGLLEWTHTTNRHKTNARIRERPHGRPSHLSLLVLVFVWSEVV